MEGRNTLQRLCSSTRRICWTRNISSVLPPDAALAQAPLAAPQGLHSPQRLSQRFARFFRALRSHETRPPRWAQTCRHDADAWHWRARTAAHPWCSIDIKAAVPGWITRRHSPAGVQPCSDFALEAARVPVSYRPIAISIASASTWRRPSHSSASLCQSEPEDRIEVREGVEARFRAL